MTVSQRAGREPAQRPVAVWQRPWAPGAVVGLVAGLLCVGPLLGGGFVLAYDMVVVPRPPLGLGLLGLGTELGRNVPAQLLMALCSRVVPAGWLQDLVLLGWFVLAGAGVAALLSRHGRGARTAAAALYVWNAFVLERLLIGHWWLLVAYAVLPWAVAAAQRMRTASAARPALLPLAGWLAAATFANPSGGVLVVATAAIVVAAPVAGRRWSRQLRRAGAVVGAGVAFSLVWIVPAVTRPGGVPPRPLGVAAFAANADTALGSVGSLLTLGGIWSRSVFPPERASTVGAALAVAVLAVAALGLVRLWRRGASGSLVGLAVAASLGFAWAAASTVPGWQHALEAAVRVVPVAGILRDAQRALLPLALLEALAFGVGVEWLAARVADPARHTAIAAGVLLPIVALPSLGLGAGGRLAAVRYPDSWADGRDVVASDPVAGGVVVLPWSRYQAYPWNAGHVVQVPLVEWWPRPVLVDDDLVVGDQVVPGEDPWVARVDTALDRGRPVAAALGSLGIRYVAVTRPDEVPADAVTGLTAVLTSDDLLLYRIPAPGPPPVTPPPRWPTLAADLLVLLLLVGLLGAQAVSRRRAGPAW